MQISTFPEALAEKAKARKLSLDEMEGGSFTISNLGGIGGTYFRRSSTCPKQFSGCRAPSWNPSGRTARSSRLMMPLSLMPDHRLIDGADAIRFVRWVAEALEQPFVMSLRGETPLVHR